jgi:hypothetical protein
LRIGKSYTSSTESVPLDTAGDSAMNDSGARSLEKDILCAMPLLFGPQGPVMSARNVRFSRKRKFSWAKSGRFQGPLSASCGRLVSVFGCQLQEL